MALSISLHISAVFTVEEHFCVARSVPQQSLLKALIAHIRLAVVSKAFMILVLNVHARVLSCVMLVLVLDVKAGYRIPDSFICRSQSSGTFICCSSVSGSILSYGISVSCSFFSLPNELFKEFFSSFFYFLMVTFSHRISFCFILPGFNLEM